MDKMITTGAHVTISNDGATILNLLDIVHPAAKVLVDIAKAQDNEVGDGTTSVVMLAGELLKEAKPFIEEGIHSSIILTGYREALRLVLLLFTFKIGSPQIGSILHQHLRIECRGET
jgi:T-complex protein 1 subunit eta